MSAPVDVLAVLDALCERAASGDPAEYREVNSLRYAVTELIEASAAMNAAAKTMQNAYRKGRLPSESSRAVFGIAKSKVDAAIARVKGGAA